MSQYCCHICPHLFVGSYTQFSCSRSHHSPTWRWLSLRPSKVPVSVDSKSQRSLRESSVLWTFGIFWWILTDYEKPSEFLTKEIHRNTLCLIQGFHPDFTNHQTIRWVVHQKPPQKDPAKTHLKRSDTPAASQLVRDARGDVNVTVAEWKRDCEWFVKTICENDRSDVMLEQEGNQNVKSTVKNMSAKMPMCHWVTVFVASFR